MRILICLVCAVGLNAQTPLPEGEGKKVVEKVCLDCHGPENFTGKKLTKEGWEKVVDDMVKSGATGTDEEFDIVVKYLTKYFGKDKDSHR
jgi:competence protein ComEA